MKAQHYRELIVWQKSMILAKRCYQLTKMFPKSELFGMTSQIRRSASSIPANIAEGNARAHTKEYLNYLSVAQGSLAELETHLILSHDVDLLKKDDLEKCLSLSDEISRMLAGLRKALQSRP
ncbi:MAG: four helix bundle protein [Planctomycetaceae bacterium]|nr:four helix bundle protein [Planctomycetaceae bacterium]